MDSTDAEDFLHMVLIERHATWEHVTNPHSSWSQEFVNWCERRLEWYDDILGLWQAQRGARRYVSDTVRNETARIDDYYENGLDESS